MSSSSLDLTNYEILKQVGTGAFGTVYKALDKITGEIVAIKIEEAKKSSRLDYEYDIYKDIKDEIGFPHIYDFTKTSKNYICIMECLGPSLEDLFEFCGKKFSLKTTLMIGIQILNRIESIHNAGIIHRDIKPDNFLIGLNKNKSRIYLIDFGLSRRYIVNNEHIEYNKDRSFTGSFRYSSLRNHKGIEQSRRDDLESIGYMLIYFLKGALPWQGLDGSTKDKRSNNIFKVKYNTSLNDLCSNIPREFLLYMSYCRLLRFKQKPDYNLLRNLFICLFKNSNYQLDYIYDWNLIAKNKKIELKEKEHN